jgi:hypothetical protein
MEYNRPGIEAFVSKLVGIKAADLDWASSLGKKYGVKEELDGRGDAARHLALGWLAANAESPSTAKRAIQAREYLDTDYIREILGGQFSGKEMDLRNNERGMQIPAKTREEAEQIIGQMIEGKEATFMTPQESYEMRGYAEGGQVSEMEPAFLEALEQQRLRKQAFDNEFAIEVAAQSNYASDIDPSMARYHGLPDAAPGYNGLMGFAVLADKRNPDGAFLDEEPIRIAYYKKSGDRDFTTIIPEAGTVNAIDRHANPMVYAHEYRHKFFPELSERRNRIADLLTALDERQLFDMLRTKYLSKKGSEALDYFSSDLRFERDHPGYGVGAKIFGAEWEQGARSTRQGIHENKDQYIRSRIEESPAIKLLNEYEDLEKYNEEAAAVRNYVNGGGVAALAPRAKAMFNTPDIRLGVGAFAPYTTRRA